jgi:hypothetical protein
LAYRTKRAHTQCRQPEKSPKGIASAPIPDAKRQFGTMPGNPDWESAGVGTRPERRASTAVCTGSLAATQRVSRGSFSVYRHRCRPLTPAAPFDGAHTRALAHRSRRAHHGYAQGASGSQKASPMARPALDDPPTGWCRESEGDISRLAATGSHRACRQPSHRGQTRLKALYRESEGVARSNRATTRHAGGRGVGVSRHQCPINPLGSGVRRRAERLSCLETGVKRRAPGVTRR